MKKWFVSTDSVGVRSGRKFLEVNYRGASNWFIQIASTDYTGTFNKKQMRLAQRVADALNEADEMWQADVYQKEKP